MKRVALYVRVSTQEQKNHGMSVDSQIEALREYCTLNGYTEVGLYNDAGISARKSYKKRPALLQLINDCSEGKVDLIIFTKLDRWFRSVADYYEVQRELDKYKVAWRSIWEDYETETSSGIFKVNIMLSVAQSEADRTSERIKAVNEYRRQSGQYVGGKAPTGYRISGHDLLIDEEKQELVKKTFDHYSKTYIINETVLYAQSIGLSLTRAQFYRMLYNPTYCGLCACGYKCEPYITEEQYNINVRSIKGRRGRTSHEKKRIYIFSGVLKCKCGCSMRGSTLLRTRVDGTPSIRKTYMCRDRYNLTCKNHHTITERKLEKKVLDALDDELNKYNIMCVTRKKGVDNKKKIAALEEKLKRIGDRYEYGDISLNEYRVKRESIIEEIKDLKAVEIEYKPKMMPSNWKEIYNQLDEHHKRAFWIETVSSITFHNSDEPLEIKF